MTTAERVTLTIEATAPRGSRFSVPLEETQFKGWTLVERWNAEPTIDPSGRSSQRSRIVLEPFLAGEYTIPSIAVTMRSASAGSIPETTRTPAIVVTVASVLAESAAGEGPSLMDYSPPHTARVDVRALVLVGATVGATVGAAVWWFVRRRMVRPSVIDERALRALTLRRAVERADLTGITPDFIAGVLAEFLPAEPRGRAGSEIETLTARLDGWRFGGASVEVGALTDAARATVRLLEESRERPVVEAVA